MRTMTGVEPATEVPRPVSRLWAIISESVDADDAARLFSDDIGDDVGAVLALIAEPADSAACLSARHVLGWFHWLRYLALDEPADQDELASACTHLAVVRKADPQAVPVPLRDLLGGGGDLSQRSSLAALLLRLGRSSSDLTALTVGLELLSEAVSATPPGDNQLSVRLSNQSAGYVELFHRTSEPSMLDAAIEAGRRACEADGTEPSLATLVNLTAALLTRYDRHGDDADLAETVSLSRAATARVDPSDPAYASCLTQLANALRLRYRRFGEDSDLDQAVTAARKAFAATSPGDDQYGGYAASLASSLINSFGERDDLAALTEAIQVLRQALAVVPDSHPQWAMQAANLSNALRMHYEQCGAARSFDEQLELADRAAAKISDKAPDAAQLLSIYANSLRTRYDRDGDEDALREALAVTRRALAITGELHREGLLGNYGASLWAWYERSGDGTALDAAIDILRQVAAANGMTGSRRAALFNNLATALQSQFERSGEVGLLDEAASAARIAVSDSRAGSLWQATHLSVLGNILLSRYQAASDSEDLDAAEQVLRQAAAAIPANHGSRGTYYCNLANALLERYERSRDLQVLDETIAILRSAVTSAAQSHPERTTYLSNLAVSLFGRYQQARDAAALEEAVDLSFQALSAMSPGHPDRGRVLSNLSYWLRLRYEISGDDGDLSAAVDTARQAMADQADDHPYRCTFAANLGAALRDRHRQTADRADLTGAIRAFREAAGVKTAPPATRLAVARAWGNEAAGDGDWPEAVTGFQVAMELLAQVTPRRLARVDQERHLVEVNGLASDAAACALSADDPALAVRWLEQGRGLLLAQALETRTEVADLRDASPALADRFESLRDALDVSHAEPSTGALPAAAPHGAAAFAADRRRDLAERYDKTIDEIRGLPGFAGFLKAPEIAELLAVAADGPIVIVNASQYRCDALIVTAGGITVVPLPVLTIDGVRRAAAVYVRLIKQVRRFPELPAKQRAELAETLGQLLHWLWDKIAAPVLGTLGYEPGTATPPRVWWCPAGVLGLLPLHAAQRYEPERGEDSGVIDRAVSSYTPTIRALRFAQSAPARPPASALVISTPDPPGRLPLRYAAREAAAVVAQLPVQSTVLAGGDATRAAVKLHLNGHSWLHFAGHSTQDLSDPGRSAISLSDGEFTVFDLVRLRTTAAGFAFLSSCEGRLGSATLPDEAIHLAGALQIAGFRDVIAVLWSIRDSAAVDIAADIYRALADVGRPGGRGPAEALHAALRRIRSTQPPLVWAAYSHAGP